MPYDKNEVAKRLRLLPQVLGKAAGEIAVLVGSNAKSWSNYTSFDEESETIPRHVVAELKRVFSITSDWLYFDDLASIRDPALREKIRKAEQNPNPKPKRGRPRILGALAFLCIAAYPTPWAWLALEPPVPVAIATPIASAKCPAYGLYKPNTTLCRTAGIVTREDADIAALPQTVNIISSFPRK